MSKIRKSAAGKECQVRIEGICNEDPATTILAHINGGGIGKKKDDIFGAYCCSSCHAVVDSLPNINHVVHFVDSVNIIKFYEGVFRTQQLMREQGLIKIGGER